MWTWLLIATDRFLSRVNANRTLVHGTVESGSCPENGHSVHLDTVKPATQLQAQHSSPGGYPVIYRRFSSIFCTHSPPTSSHSSPIFPLDNSYAQLLSPYGIHSSITQVHVSNNASLSILINQRLCMKFMFVIDGNCRYHGHVNKPNSNHKYKCVRLLVESINHL